VASRKRSRRALALAAVVAAFAVSAQPTGAVVLKTITVDGSMADWAEVLADPTQNATDGLPDKDAPVPTTGRDLERFAWTFDATHLYLYTARAGSDANRQRFWFYLDTNDNQRMNTGEPVILVSWFGSNRRTDIERHSYVAVSPAGDMMTSAAGQADGFTLPGTTTNPVPLESLFGGSATGREMEVRVAWTALGVPYGTPMRFHESASASSNLPAQVHDNMGGPGGGLGYIRATAVRIDPDQTWTVMPAAVAALPHVVSNLGLATDTVELGHTVSGAFAPQAVAWIADLDGDGMLDAGDPALTDTDGDGRVDTGPLAAGATRNVLLRASAPAGAVDGQTATFVLTAVSAAMAAATDTATDLLRVASPRLTLLKSADRATAAPGDPIRYTVAYTSAGTTDAHGVVLVDAVPVQTAYLSGSATASAPGTVIEFSHDGGLSFDGSEAAPITHLRFRLAAALAPGGTGSVAYRASVR
jgi:uncharacterized repeat protein (TIGR01451 family)